MTPTDRIRVRMVQNNMKSIQEHLEAMSRDSHGMEYRPWKLEVDGLWKSLFEHVGGMTPDTQKASLDMVRDLWMMYLSHYAQG